MNLLKTIAVLIAAAVVLAAPWPIGGNLPYVRTVLLLISGLLAALATGLMFAKDQAQSLSLIWFVIPIGVAYAFYQTLPLGLDGTSISVQPFASKAELYSLASAVGLFFASVAIFQSRRLIHPIMFAVTIVGTAVALVGIAQNLSGNGKVLWSYDLLFGGGPFGPFVNRNNGAGFMVACATGAVFFLATQIFEWRKTRRPSGMSFLDEMPKQKGGANLLRALTGLFAELETKHLYCVAALMIIVTGVFLSFSRGGSISVLIALMVALAFVSISNRWVLALAILVAAGCVALGVYVEQADAVADRLATLAEVDDADNPRLLHWQDSIPYYKAYLQTGSGLGTYQYVYPEYQNVPFRGKFAHAENVFLETLAELGIGGLMALCITIFLVFYHSICLFRRRGAFDQALGVAGAFCITGQVFCSVFDFGIYQPANFTVMAILLGCIVGRSTAQIDVLEGEKNDGWVQPIVAIVVLVSIVIGCGLSVRPSYAVESVRKAKRLIRRHRISEGQDVRSLKNAKELLLSAEKIIPNDWEIAFFLGEANLYEHRQLFTETIIQDAQEQAKEALVEAASQAVPAGATPPEIQTPVVVREDSDDIESTLPTRGEYWALSSENHLHRLFRLTQRSNNQKFIDLHDDPTLVTDPLRSAYRYFNTAQQSFDRDVRSVYRKAQLAVVFETPDESKQIELENSQRVLEFSYGNINKSFACGLLALQTGDQSRAVELWSDCLSRSRRYESQIVENSMGLLPYKQLFEQVLPQNPQQLLRISRKYFSSPNQSLPNKFLLVHTKRLINQQLKDPNEKFALLAQAYFQSEEYPEAVRNYRLALEADPSKVDLRFDFAKSLHQIGAYDEAIKELKICELESKEHLPKIRRLIRTVQKERSRLKDISP